MKKTLEQAAEESALKKYPSFTAENYDLVMAIRKAYANGFKAGAEWQRKRPITFNCIGKQVTMTVQQLIDYYIDRECTDVAYECGF